MTDELVRLSKLMAQRGLCSRREADAWIEQGLVFVDGARIDQLGTKVRSDQTITLDRRARLEQSALATILLNKPVGYVSGQPEKGYPPAVQLIIAEAQEPDASGRTIRPEDFRGLAPAGRLDIDSRGLLVFTQDGRIARQLTSATGDVDKEYQVTVDRAATADELALLRHGLELDGAPLRPADVEPSGPRRLRFVLREGRKRQIRRMCEQVGLEVRSLVRVRIGRISLGKLATGQWRFLREDEAF